MRVAVSNRLIHRERCLLQVVLDGLQINRGGELKWEDGFDLNTLRVDQLYAVEIYRSAGEIPAEYNNANAACGVLVLWSKRLLP